MSAAIWIGRVVKPTKPTKLPELPPKKRISGKQYRIIATCYPPINLFEKHVPPKMLDALWQLEALTNPRLMDEAGDLNRVTPEDRVSGPGASVVMASFTHIGQASRFTDGSYGVYYVGRTQETAIRETVHHRQLIAADASLSPTEFSLRVWIGTFRKHLHDIRSKAYDKLHDNEPRPQDHALAQAFGKELRMKDSWGVVFRSIRHEGGECIAAFRPPCVSLPTQGAHLIYVWNGEKITQVYEKTEPLLTFE